MVAIVASAARSRIQRVRGSTSESPGNSYPFWNETSTGGVCTIEFGNVTPSVNAFGRDAQYGKDHLA